MNKFIVECIKSCFRSKTFPKFAAPMIYERLLRSYSVENWLYFTRYNVSGVGHFSQML